MEKKSVRFQNNITYENAMYVFLCKQLQDTGLKTMSPLATRSLTHFKVTLLLCCFFFLEPLSFLQALYPTGLSKLLPD